MATQKRNKFIKLSRSLFQIAVYIVLPIIIFLQLGWIAGVLYVLILLGLDFIAGAYAFAYEKGKLNDVN